MSERERLAAIIGGALGAANNGNLNKFIADQVLASGFSCPDSSGEGIWTMTETEFNASLAKAWSEGWDAGAGWPQQDINPYDATK